MKRGSRRRCLVPAVAVAALVAGCSGGDKPPQEVASDYVTSTGPEKCRLLTTELLERQTGRRGPDALRFCEGNVAREQPPGDVRVVETEIVAGKAQVELVVDQAEERIELSKMSDGWRISAFPR